MRISHLSVMDDVLRQSRGVALPRIMTLELDRFVWSPGELAAFSGSVGSLGAPFQVWPLVRCAKLWGPWEILRGGCVFVDLPGTGDSNAVRNKIAQREFARADLVCICARIDRAATNKAAMDWLSKTSRDLPEGSAALVCTKRWTKSSRCLRAAISSAAGAGFDEPRQGCSLVMDFSRECEADLEELERFINEPRRVQFPAFGNTGAGKSTLFNGVLCEHAVPTPGWRACTAVPVELCGEPSWAEYRAEVHLKNPEEWAREVQQFLNDSRA